METFLRFESFLKMGYVEQEGEKGVEKISGHEILAQK